MLSQFAGLGLLPLGAPSVTDSAFASAAPVHPPPLRPPPPSPSRLRCPFASLPLLPLLPLPLVSRVVESEALGGVFPVVPGFLLFLGRSTPVASSWRPHSCRRRFLRSFASSVSAPYSPPIRNASAADPCVVAPGYAAAPAAVVNLSRSIASPAVACAAGRNDRMCCILPPS